MLLTGYSRRTLLAFFLALLVHLMLLAILMVSLGWPSKSQPAKQDTTPVVQATVVDEDKLLAEAEQQQQVSQEALEVEPGLAETQRQRQAAAEQARQKAERQRELERQQQEQERLRQLKAKRQAKEGARRKAEAEKKRIEEEKRRAEAEKQRLEEEKERRQAEAERKRAEEERRRAEAEKKRLEEERRRVEEAATKRKAEEERRQRELQARLEAEQNAVQERQIKADLARFEAQVQSRVKRYWIRPPGARDNLVVLLQVEMLPSGEVRNVEVIQSSGDRAFDRSAQAAVYKAAPLPVPPDPTATAKLLPRFNFRFIPGS